MSTAVVEQPVQQTQESMGWRAGLPDDLKTNETLVPFKTVGDFAKHHLEVSTKVSKLETQLKDAIPKLPDDATDEDRDIYYTALGRPAQASAYEFEGGDKTDPNWVNGWKSEFHKLGLTQAQAKGLTAAFNQRGQEYMSATKAARDTELAAAEKLFRTEMGDEYDTSVELAKRMTQKHIGKEFDVVFANADPMTRLGVVQLLLKIAPLTGEDTSPQGGKSGASAPRDPKDAWMEMYKNPKPGIGVGRK